MADAPDTGDIETVPLGELHRDPENARRGDVGQIVESLREFGQHRPIVAQRETGRIIAGNHVYRAMQVLGWDDAVVWWVDDDDEEAARRSLADNLTGDLATWDEEQLASMLEEVGKVPGLDDRAYERMTRDVQELAAATQPDYPLVTKVDESYDYLLVVATNDVDRTWLENLVERRKEASYKSDEVGVSRVVQVPELRTAIEEYQ